MARLSLSAVLSITFTYMGRFLCVRHDHAVWGQLETHTGRYNPNTANDNNYRLHTKH